MFMAIIPKTGARIAVNAHAQEVRIVSTLMTIIKPEKPEVTIPRRRTKRRICVNTHAQKLAIPSTKLAVARREVFVAPGRGSDGDDGFGGGLAGGGPAPGPLHGRG